MAKRIPYDERTIRFAARYLRKHCLGRSPEFAANALDNIAKSEARKRGASTELTEHIAECSVTQG